MRIFSVNVSKSIKTNLPTLGVGNIKYLILMITTDVSLKNVSVNRALVKLLDKGIIYRQKLDLVSHVCRNVSIR